VAVAAGKKHGHGGHAVNLSGHRSKKKRIDRCGSS
jgi:hypothetical protein